MRPTVIFVKTAAIAGIEAVVNYCRVDSMQSFMVIESAVVLAEKLHMSQVHNMQ